MSKSIPTPSLVLTERLGVSFYTDERLFAETGIRIAFTRRTGGAGSGAYESLNLGSHVGDDPSVVGQNRKLVLDAIGAPSDVRLVTLDQVHGSDIFAVDDDFCGGQSPSMLEAPAAEADSLIIRSDVKGIAGMLFFADCVPVTAVAPTGDVALIHSGWRGVISRNAAKTVIRMAQECRGCEISDINIYIGPCIRRECFEVDEDLRNRFAEEFGSRAEYGRCNVDLPGSIISMMEEIGVGESRICDLGLCTVCDDHEFFSYRASGGTCGRHAVVACRTA